LLVGAKRLVKRPLVIRVEVYAPKGGWGMVTVAVASRSARLVEEVVRVLGEKGYGRPEPSTDKYGFHRVAYRDLTMEDVGEIMEASRRVLEEAGREGGRRGGDRRRPQSVSN